MKTKRKSPASSSQRLPELCYVSHPTTGRTAMIRRGESHYYPVDTVCSPACLNSKLQPPPTEDEIAAMKHGSIIGWETPGANPEWWRRRREDHSLRMDQWGDTERSFKHRGQEIAYAAGQSVSDDRLWAYANGDLGFFGWLHAVNRRVSEVAKIHVLDLPDRLWRDEYDGRVPPSEAADVAIDEAASKTGL